MPSFKQRATLWHPLKQTGLALLLLSVLVLLAFSGVAFASPVSSSAAQQGKSLSFTCIKKPLVQAPPPNPLPANMKSVKVPTRAVCPKGQIPQPIAKHDAKERPSAPVPESAQIAPGLHYVTGVVRNVVAFGAEAELGQYAPFLAASDAHTLAEVAVETTDGKQIVEVGWTVDRGLNGDSNPHLFVFHWVNGMQSCYNGCGYQQYSDSFGPGMTVTSDGAAPSYLIEFYQGNWWIWYGTQWIGYFPESLWTDGGVLFGAFGQAQFFGEVNLGRASNTQMGNGVFGSNPGSAVIKNAAIIDTSYTVANVALSVFATDPDCYDYSYIPGESSFSYGGPGCPAPLVTPTPIGGGGCSATQPGGIGNRIIICP